MMLLLPHYYSLNNNVFSNSVDPASYFQIQFTSTFHVSPFPFLCFIPLKSVGSSTNLDLPDVWQATMHQIIIYY